MAAPRPLWLLWVRGLALLWGCAGTGLAQLTATVPPAPAQACSEFSQRSCEECLKNVSCLWCYTNNTCIDYPVRSILPPSSLCALSNARWGVCWINFEDLIIAVAVIAGLILVSVTVCCCYCCYCRKRSRSTPDEEEEQLARKREERRLQSLQSSGDNLHEEPRILLTEDGIIAVALGNRANSGDCKVTLVDHNVRCERCSKAASGWLIQKHERKLKHDEIRKKYGLLQDSDNPYSRFENE